MIIPGLICLFIITKYILVKKENKLLSEKLTETTIKLKTSTKKLKDLQKRHTEINNFHKSIKHAEITTRLQATRLQTVHGKPVTTGSLQNTNKYSHIRSLTQQGMAPEEIAATLSISQHEARQLVSLTKLREAA